MNTITLLIQSKPQGPVSSESNLLYLRYLYRIMSKHGFVENEREPFFGFPRAYQFLLWVQIEDEISAEYGEAMNYMFRLSDIDISTLGADAIRYNMTFYIYLKENFAAAFNPVIPAPAHIRLRRSHYVLEKCFAIFFII